MFEKGRNFEMWWDDKKRERPMSENFQLKKPKERFENMPCYLPLSLGSELDKILAPCMPSRPVTVWNLLFIVGRDGH